MPRENSSPEEYSLTVQAKELVTCIVFDFQNVCIHTCMNQEKKKKNSAIQISSVFLIKQLIKVFQRTSDISGIIKYFRSYSVTSNIILLYIFIFQET